ncbi:MAG: hypothetical protein JNK82_27925, partial [Myxococcaceae bacterium]|nr:hypothetical protein [Myxococcaceae bacterium]
QKPAGPATVALPPGRYAVRMRTDDGYRERTVEVAADTTASVHADDMADGELIRVAVKGSADAWLNASVGGALTSGMLASLSYGAGAEARLQLPKLLPGVLGLAVGFRVSDGQVFSQYEVEARLGWLWRWSPWRLSFGIGPEVGFVVVVQNDLPDRSRRIGLEPYFGAAGEARLRLAGPLSLVLGVGGGALVVKTISRTSAVPRAAGFLGLAFDVL